MVATHAIKLSVIIFNGSHKRWNEFSVQVFVLQELVPMDTQVQYSSSRTFVASLIQSVSRLKEISERLVKRSLELSVDMKQIAGELRLAFCKAALSDHEIICV